MKHSESYLKKRVEELMSEVCRLKEKNEKLAKENEKLKGARRK